MSDFEKLINASDLIEWIMETYPDWCEGAIRSIVDHVEAMSSAQPEPLTLRVNNELTKEEYDKLMQDIKDAPIVLLPSAQPEIIRCRDCKHWDKTWINNWPPDYHYCPMVDGVHKGDFYCADAERRTDE